MVFVGFFGTWFCFSGDFVLGGLTKRPFFRDCFFSCSWWLNLKFF